MLSPQGSLVRRLAIAFAMVAALTALISAIILYSVWGGQFDTYVREGIQDTADGAATILAVGSSFLVAGYAPRVDGGVDLFVVRASPSERPHPLRNQVIESSQARERKRPPALARVGDERAAIVAVAKRLAILMCWSSRSMSTR